MKAVILAAGFQTRLQGIDTPKSLLKCKGKIILDHLVEKLHRVDEITEIILLTNKKYFNHFEKWHSASTYTKVRLYSNGVDNKDDKLGALGDIVYAIDTANVSEDVLVTAADNFYLFSLREIVKRFFKDPETLLICAHMQKDIGRINSQLVLDGEFVAEFIEKPSDPKPGLSGMPLYCIPAKHIPIIRQAADLPEYRDNMGSLLEYALAQGVQIRCAEIDNPARYFVDRKEHIDELGK